jgi:hypothetical protein
VNTGIWTDQSIYTDRAIVTNDYFVAHGGTVSASDIRIKKEIQDIDTNTALHIIRQVQPKTYQYRDTIKSADDVDYGFIAQEVKEIVPNAVRYMNKEIPDVYELANVTCGNTITFPSKSTSNLRIGGRMVLIDSKNNQVYVKVEDIIDESTFKIDTLLTSEQIGVDNSIFVFGNIVDDFHNLNKDVIFTIAVAALKTVDHQLQVAESKIEQLHTELANIKTHLGLI